MAHLKIEQLLITESSK